MGIVPAEMSDVAKVLSLLLSAATTVILAYLAYLTERVKDAQREAATKVEKVRQTLEVATQTENEKLLTISTTTASTHALVSSAMCEQLRLGAELSRWKANQTGNVVDVAAAEQAERLYREYCDKQAAAEKV